MEVYNRYIEEIKTDTIVDEISLKEKALLLPGIKAKWVARLINHKNTLNKLEKQKIKAVQLLTEKIKQEAPIKLHNNIAKEKAEGSAVLTEINEKITEEKLIIELLDKVEKIFSSMSFDISNIIKIVQLETT
jgi:hypothetical protein